MVWLRSRQGSAFCLAMYTGCFTTCGHYSKRWFSRSLWSKNSYKQVFDFWRLRSYGHFLIPVHTLVWAAFCGTSWRLMHSTWWLIVCVEIIIFAKLSRPPSYTVQFPYLDTWKVFKECGEGGVGEYSPG